ncbi:vomeronasal type-1 receptor 4-like [Otolemur garnettii]|uniref:vomeronasal type-1 receptor 4-like n=1 Tax=Otolemur garnettii TaxID=30611 RepID=UPI000C7E97A8|nr:vomeronasal type-1 receptor 4-like [Otolemur garnettii]
MTMTPGDLILRLLFVLQTGIGVLGNTFLLLTYTSTACTGQAPRPTHLILTNLAVANVFFLLFKGIPQMILIWGVTHTLGNMGCKLVTYFHRTARGLSLCITGHLSSFQAITISPRTGGWMKLKDAALKKVGFSCFLCWISNLLINLFVPVRVGALQHSHNATRIPNFGLCSTSKKHTMSDAVIYVILMTSSDVVFMGLMLGASVYMVLLLHRHHQRVRHIHTLSTSHRFSPEAKATQTILLLATAFIFFYFINSIFIIYHSVFSKSHIWLHHMTTFLAVCYPTVSPLILILRDPQTLSFCSFMWKKKVPNY